jgi:hypothetical protein
LDWILTCASQEMGVMIGFFVARTVWGIIAIFRFKFLIGEKVVDVFENEFVTMVRVACGCSEVA